jgi:Glycosyl transferase family 2
MNQKQDINRILSALSAQDCSQIEIIIRDDSVNDETEVLVKSYTCFKNIIYFHGKPEGIDNTILFLTKKAKGAYLWWFGDDNFAPTAIKQILKSIKLHKNLDFIWANNIRFESGSLAIAFEKDRYFKSRDEVLLAAWSGLGFISSTILRRDLALNALSEASSFIGTDFVNLFIVLHVLANSEYHYYIRGPVVINYPALSAEIKTITTNRVAGKIVNNAFQVFGLNFMRITKYFKNNFDPAVIYSVNKRNFSCLWRGIIVGWIGGWDTPSNKRIKMLTNFYMFPEVIPAFILFCLPKKLNSLFYSIFQKFRAS